MMSAGSSRASVGERCSCAGPPQTAASISRYARELLRGASSLLAAGHGPTELLPARLAAIRLSRVHKPHAKTCMPLDHSIEASTFRLHPRSPRHPREARQSLSSSTALCRYLHAFRGPTTVLRATAKTYVKLYPCRCT